MLVKRLHKSAVRARSHKGEHTNSAKPRHVSLACERIAGELCIPRRAEPRDLMLLAAVLERHLQLLVVGVV